MFLRWGKRETEEMPERPKIYVTSQGKMYVKPNELLRSRIGQRRTQEMAEFAERQKKRAAKLREMRA